MWWFLLLYYFLYLKKIYLTKISFLSFLLSYDHRDQQRLENDGTHELWNIRKDLRVYV